MVAGVLYLVLRRLSIASVLWTLVLVVLTFFGARWTVLGAVRQNGGVRGIDGLDLGRAVAKWGW